MSSGPGHSAALKPWQLKAMATVRAQAVALAPESVQTITYILSMSNIDPSALDGMRRDIREHAHIALHFHPDRPVGDGLVAHGLLEDGVYKNQFETGISNGLVSAAPNGPRDMWEKSLFGGAYHECGVEACDRPKYGALDLGCSPDGPAPRFGSCFLLLKPEVSRRCTFTFGGSQSSPKSVATIDEFDSILASILEEAFTRDSMLGLGNMRPAQVVGCLGLLSTPRRCRTDLVSRNLDHMVEAQVHGDVLLGRDVEALVADPSFERGESGRVLRSICERYGMPLQFHGGFRMRVQDVPDNFRGPRMPSLAGRVARSVVDAEAIGSAAQEAWRNGERWRDGGTYDEVLQELKLLWHVLVRFG